MWRWPERLPGQDDSYLPLRNCPALGSEKQIYAAIGRHLVALAEQQDQVQLVWKYATGGHIPGSPALGADLLIRVHAGDGRLHFVTQDGQSAWPAVPVGEPLGWASPLVDAAGNTWICAYAGGLVRVDGRAGGSGAPYFRSRQRFDCTGLVERGVCYVGGEDGFVRAIDVAGGKGKNRWRTSDDRGKTEWFVNSAPARSPAGPLIVAGRDEFLYAFGDEGQLIARLHIRGQMLGAPVIDSSGDVYVGVSLLERGREPRGKLVCASHDLAQVRWEYPADGAVESTAVLGDDGLVYFGDNAGMIHAVRSDGRGAWKEPVGAAVRSAGCISAGGRIVFGLDDGSLVALASTARGLASGGWPKYLAGTANRTE